MTNAEYQSTRWRRDPAFRLAKYLRDRSRALGIPITEVPMPKPRNSRGIFTGKRDEAAPIVLKARHKPIQPILAGLAGEAGKGPNAE